MSTSASVSRPKVLVCDPIHADGITLLQAHAEVDVIGSPGLTVAELAVRIGDYQAVINRSRTSLPAAVIQQGKQLRIIARAGVGLDNIDVAAAEAQGITVVNCPDSTTVSVAEHTLALILGVAKQLGRSDQGLKAGRWEKSKLNSEELSGKTLGIIGFGRIGREVTKRAKAFDMHVVVNQTRFTPELAQAWQVENVDLTELLQRADFVTLHVPLRPSNLGLLGAAELALMKPTAYLIHTSRGGIVDEAALLAALERGQLAGAALDVFVGEPQPNPQLVGHPRVLATPHIAANTEDAQRRAAVMAAEQVLALFRRRSAAETLGLQLVAVNQLLPHEFYDLQRVTRLAERIAADGLLANPPLVVALPNDERLIVLDGATRTTAFQHLQYPHIVVQVVDPQKENVQLHTWFHAVRGKSAGELLRLVQSTAGLRLTEMAVEQLAHALWERSALAYLVTADKQGFLLELSENLGEHDWLSVLTDLVRRYGTWGEVERTLVDDIDSLLSQHRDLAGLLVFPQFALEIVMQQVAKGHLLPAGITRFVVPGRILRLNVPLAVLASNEPMAKKRAWLDKWVETKLANRGLRYYQEPVVLLDE